MPSRTGGGIFATAQKTLPYEKRGHERFTYTMMSELQFCAPSSYPAALLPLVTELPARDADWLRVIKYSRPQFSAWPVGRFRPKDTRGGKPLVAVSDGPAFAEIAILREFQADGWEGRWIDNFPLPPTFRTHYWDAEWNKLPRDLANNPLPQPVRQIYDSICEAAGNVGGTGAWDIIAWRGREIAFVEAKHRSSTDRIKDEQLDWLIAAVNIGLPPACFVFAEWTARQ